MTPAVMVVEDDPLVMLSAATSLGDHGWAVKMAANGRVAMDRLSDVSTRLDALVIDKRLGQGPTGWDVARHARSVRPDIPVAYITGCADAGDEAEMVAGSVLLEKPVSDAALLTALETLMSGR